MNATSAETRDRAFWVSFGFSLLSVAFGLVVVIVSLRATEYSGSGPSS